MAETMLRRQIPEPLELRYRPTVNRVAPDREQNRVYRDASGSPGSSVGTPAMIRSLDPRNLDVTNPGRAIAAAEGAALSQANVLATMDARPTRASKVGGETREVIAEKTGPSVAVRTARNIRDLRSAERDHTRMRNTLAASSTLDAALQAAGDGINQHMQNKLRQVLVTNPVAARSLADQASRNKAIKDRKRLISDIDPQVLAQAPAAVQRKIVESKYKRSAPKREIETHPALTNYTTPNTPGYQPQDVGNGVSEASGGCGWKRWAVIGGTIVALGGGVWLLTR